MSGKVIVRGFLATAVFLAANGVMADIFGTGVNQFTIDFVGISGATNPTSGYCTVNHDYRMGAYEITNGQWNKFTASLGVPVTGSGGGYDWNSGSTGLIAPTVAVSWYEAAQFVNYLNTSTGNQAAYKFTGTQGTTDYAFAAWSNTDAGYDASNPYRNKAAKYFLPTANEWVKAGYWNSATLTLQNYATKDGNPPTQGNGTTGIGWNYDDNGFATNPHGAWNVGSGSQELNGTYDMMGNVSEWMESPSVSGDYGASSFRASRGANWESGYLDPSWWFGCSPATETNLTGFRVASVPEPSSVAMLVGIALAALLCWRRK
jgi:formylglycine-generating enzyme required for sulfatase activity